ncbi:MAG: dihydroorotase [Lachnospiraceae bacterium]|nr:dihydroorotase [Lachnospiraceae bacterium]
MLYIKNGRVIDPLTKKDGILDVFIKQGKIAKVADRKAMTAYLKENGLDESRKDMKVIDAEGCVVAPGLTDVHVHFRDPGFTYKEDILSGAKAALAGGITTVVLMANTRPVVDNEETLSYVLQKGKESGLRVKTCASISKGLKGKEPVDMVLLKEKGAAGFTDDGIPLLEEAFVKAAMEQAVKLGMPLSFHEENPAYITNNGINKGKASEHYGIGGSDRMAEISMIDRDIRLAQETGAQIDIQHISTKEGVELVRKARATHANIHAEATPHHFSLTEDAAIKYGTLAKMNPPLRTEEDRMAIIEGLADGTIEIIATDHAPHAGEEKEKPLTEAPSGILGLETALPLAVTNLVRPGHMTLMQVIERMTLGPAALYGFEPDSIEEGKRADVIVFNPEETFRYEKSLSKSQNSPFLGQTLYGKLYATIVDGEVVYQRK